MSVWWLLVNRNWMRFSYLPPDIVTVITNNTSRQIGWTRVFRVAKCVPYCKLLWRRTSIGCAGAPSHTRSIMTFVPCSAKTIFRAFPVLQPTQCMKIITIGISLFIITNCDSWHQNPYSKHWFFISFYLQHNQD